MLLKLIFPWYLRIHNVNNIMVDTNCLFIPLKPKLITRIINQVSKHIAIIFMMMIFTVVCQVIVSVSAYYHMVNILGRICIGPCPHPYLKIYPAFSLPSKTCQVEYVCGHCKIHNGFHNHSSSLQYGFEPRLDDRLKAWISSPKNAENLQQQLSCCLPRQPCSPTTSSACSPIVSSELQTCPATIPSCLAVLSLRYHNLLVELLGLSHLSSSWTLLLFGTHYTS